MSFLSWSRRVFAVPGGEPSNSDPTSEPASLKLVCVSSPARECAKASELLASANQTPSGIVYPPQRRSSQPWSDVNERTGPTQSDLAPCMALLRIVICQNADGAEPRSAGP